MNILTTTSLAPSPTSPRRADPGPRARAVATTVRWAADEADLRAAQRLRHQVFAEELGAIMAPPPGTPPGHDADLFDPFCEHLLAIAGDQVVGTYRVLTADAARRAGCFYLETEFDLFRLRSQRSGLVELGRACVHPDWRRGGTMLALWGGLFGFMDRNRFAAVIGAASVGARDGGGAALALWARLAREHLAPPELHALPRRRLPADEPATAGELATPALIQGYLRCGGRLIGEPAWDPAFQVADLPMMLRMRDLPAAYSRHFAHGAVR